NPGFAQTIPADSLYLGQTPPEDSAVVFAPGIVTVPNRNVPCISFSPDGKSAVFYVAFWPNPGTPYTMLTEYKNDRWSVPAPASFTTNRTTGEPIFAHNGSRIYMFASGVSNQVGSVDLSYSEKNGTGWSNPKSMGNPPNLAEDQYHPCLVADSSVYFSTSSGDIARCQYKNGRYQPRVIFPFPVNKANTTQTWGDPYVSPDESYLIFKSTRTGGYGLNDIYISYKKADGSWTNPKNLGNKINTPNDETAGDITPDGKYMTFASNKSIYWVSTSFIETLKNTNFVPYLKTKLKNQTGKVGESFSYTIPDSTFIDDDGNNTLTWYVTSRLPEGLNFDADTRTLSGTPSEAETFKVTVLAIDSSEVSVSTTFTLKINNSSGLNIEALEQAVQIFPNPAKDRIYLSIAKADYCQANISITDLSGKQIFSSIIQYSPLAMINLRANPAGIYFLKLTVDGVVINKKILLE
ncbi:MAG: putative Ig domain-containing protein, partial [Bacteroidia bacterium]|nr:putative Ig domain-containing protein [Bacteroidia bacterium]